MPAPCLLKQVANKLPTDLCVALSVSEQPQQELAALRGPTPLAVGLPLILGLGCAPDATTETPAGCHGRLSAEQSLAQRGAFLIWCVVSACWMLEKA